MKRITITLTEDQATYLFKVLNYSEGYVQNGRSVAFNKRLATKIMGAILDSVHTAK